MSNRTDRVTWSRRTLSTGYLGVTTLAGRPPLRIGQHGKITRNYLGDGVWLARCRFRDLDGVTRRVERIDEILKGIRRDHGATRERHTKVALNSVLTDAVLAGAIAANPVRELGIRRKRKGDPKVKGAPALGVHQVRALLIAISE